MSKVLVLQSCKPGARTGWLAECMESVKVWATRLGYSYEAIGDELFDGIPADVRELLQGRGMNLADIGRATTAQRRLAAGACDKYIWIDSDVLVFDPGRLRLPLTQPVTFCREFWVMEDAQRRLERREEVNNAVCLYSRGAPFLDFYIETCLRTVRREGRKLDRLALGVHLPSALHRVYKFSLVYSVPNLSPWVIRDLLAGGGPCLKILRDEHLRWNTPAAAANLCCSLGGMRFGDFTLDEGAFGRLVPLLQARGAEHLGPAA